MEVIDSTLISNREVLDFLETTKKHPSIATIVYETTSYLKTPASRENIQQFLNAIKNFGLTQLEKIQIANLQPKSENDLRLMVDNKFTDEQLAEISNLINATLNKEYSSASCDNQASDENVKRIKFT